MTASIAPTQTPTPPAEATGDIQREIVEAATADAEPAASSDNLEGADTIKEAVTEQSNTIGTIIEQLDAWGFTVADTRFSLWTVLLVVLVVLAVVIGARILTALAKKLLRRATRLSSTQELLAEKLVTIAVWALAIFVGIDVLGIDLTAFAVFSGAFGLAIGFGLQKTFGNLISGIILLMDRSIKPGDVIAVTDMAGNETFGQIRKIGIRAVSVTTRDQREYLIPNENLMINQVENWSYSSKQVRMQVPVGISYQCDIAKAEELMLEAAKACPRVLETPPPTVWLTGYGESSVDFTIHCWIVDPEEGVGNVRSDVLKKLWYLFQEAGIEIPFPQRDINLRDNQQVQQLIAALSQRTERPAD